MNRILIPLILTLLLLVGCSEPSDTENKNPLEEYLTQNSKPRCPKNHIDSIIPIIYGFPSEEDFQKSDSGLVALGGCELPENAPSWYCKIHDISF